jgi:hypothetical protein
MPSFRLGVKQQKQHMINQGWRPPMQDAPNDDPGLGFPVGLFTGLLLGALAVATVVYFWDAISLWLIGG